MFRLAVAEEATLQDLLKAVEKTATVGQLHLGNETLGLHSTGRQVRQSKDTQSGLM